MFRLNHYEDGAWYDAEYVHIRSDIPLYTSIAREMNGGSILELACGTGRLSFPMAEAGASVVGLDVEPAMLRQAERKRKRVPPSVANRLRFVAGDMRHFSLPEQFDCVVLGFNAILHMLEDNDLLSVLESSRRHLAPGGRFYLDLFTPYPDFVERDPEGRYDPQQMIDPSGHRWIVSENNRYDPRRQINHMLFYYQRVDAAGVRIGEELMAEVLLRVLFPRELDTFIHRAGLRIVAEHEDYGRTRPYTARIGLRVLELEVDEQMTETPEPSGDL